MTGQDQAAALRAARPVAMPDLVARRVVWRGLPVHVLRNPATGRYFRATPRLYALVRACDGKRSVADALATLPPGSPDDAALLRMLPRVIAAGLLRVPGQRVPGPRPPGLLAPARALTFTRLRLLDLGRLMPLLDALFGWLYSRAGVAFVLALWGIATWALAGRGAELDEQWRRLGALTPDELAIGYALFLGAKALHEAGHALAAHRMARAEGLRADVFPAGMSFMFLLPAPYVDVSAIWMLQSRWRRVAVDLGGIWMDLALAGVAAVGWTLVGPGRLGNALFDLVLICAVSSLLFNLNPLVRLDGYHAASDLLEIDNLFLRAQRAMRRVGLAALGGERPRRGDAWLVAWTLASWTYRWFIYLGVFWLAARTHPVLGAAVAATVVVLFVLLPAARVAAQWRGAARHAPLRAAAAAGAVALLAGAAALLPLPVHVVIHGIVWHEDAVQVYARGDARLAAVAAPGAAGADPVIVLHNPESERLLAQLRTEAAAIALEARRQRAEDPSRADATAERARAVAEQIAELRAQMADWTVHAPPGALWEPLDSERLRGTWVRRDEARPLGVILGGGQVVLRFVLDQWDGPAVMAALGEAPDRRLPVRLRGESAAGFEGRALSPRPEARDDLPSAALAQPAGGPIPVQADPRTGAHPIERVFELRVVPETMPEAALLQGMRVEALVALPPSPLLAQLWFRARQALQRRLPA